MTTRAKSMIIAHITFIIVTLALLACAANPTPQSHVHYQSLHSLISQYTREHSAQVLEQEALNTSGNAPLCHRRFVVATYSCPMQMGNRFNEFLNNYLGALVTNRTVLWKYCDREYCHTQEQQCSEAIRRNAWLPSLERVSELLKLSACPMTSDGPNAEDLHLRSINLTDFTPTLIDWSLENRELKLACMDIDTLPQRFVQFGVLERREMFVSLALKGSKMISHSSSKDRRDVLLALGEQILYGYMMRSAFSFTDKIIQWNLEALKSVGIVGMRDDNNAYSWQHKSLTITTSSSSSSSSSLSSVLNNNSIITVKEDNMTMPILLAVHVRHLFIRKSSSIDPEVNCILQTLQKMVNDSPTGTPCSVLLASDKRDVVNKITDVIATRLNGSCHVVSATTTNPNSKPIMKDHGEFGDSFTAVADLHLLSHALDFIGSTDSEGGLSTYSKLIDSLIVTNKLWHNRHIRKSTNDAWQLHPPRSNAPALPPSHSPSPRYPNGIMKNSPTSLYVQPFAINDGNMSCFPAFCGRIESRQEVFINYTSKEFSWQCALA